ncbi:uncharacterized protein [Aristolochia californica]|uniref:uncharacterized protein isoform X2 n=1 Tax=Aristolochia californica TaxID=171875 RepID=UPI0035DF2F55
MDNRYKESISKSTKGLKEKLLAHNNSVKEVSKEVHREVTAGVTRIIERLDPAFKRTISLNSSFSRDEGDSEFSHGGKFEQEQLVSNPIIKGSRTACHITSNRFIHASSSLGTVLKGHDGTSQEGSDSSSQLPK